MLLEVVTFFIVYPALHGIAASRARKTAKKHDGLSVQSSASSVRNEILVVEDKHKNMVSSVGTEYLAA